VWAHFYRLPFGNLQCHVDGCSTVLLGQNLTNVMNTLHCFRKTEHGDSIAAIGTGKIEFL
jgi:hypothetical protein